MDLGQGASLGSASVSLICNMGIIIRRVITVRGVVKSYAKLISALSNSERSALWEVFLVITVVAMDLVSLCSVSFDACTPIHPNIASLAPETGCHII